jgi:pre-mRNA cleavage complex 2 protein Pcf11
MDAYSSVDRNTRKKLDEMLKTWRNPVPGSVDTRPVFPVEITKKIENALIQVKTRTVQFEQQQQRAQQELLQRRVGSNTPATQWRNTPTPPQNGSRFQPPPSQGYPPVNGHASNVG